MLLLDYNFADKELVYKTCVNWNCVRIKPARERDLLAITRPPLPQMFSLSDGKVWLHIPDQVRDVFGIGDGGVNPLMESGANG